MLTIAKLTHAAGHALRTHAVPVAMKLAEHAAAASVTHMAVSVAYSAVSKARESVRARQEAAAYDDSLRDSGGSD